MLYMLPEFCVTLSSFDSLFKGSTKDSKGSQDMFFDIMKGILTLSLSS